MHARSFSALSLATVLTAASCSGTSQSPLIPSDKLIRPTLMHESSVKEKVIYNFRGEDSGAHPNGLSNMEGTLYGTTSR